MSIPNNLCLRCMKPGDGTSKCPHCGWVKTENVDPYLKLNTILQQRYVVGCLLLANGEGATYSGWDSVMNAPVQIREFMPVNIAVRNSTDNSIRAIAGCEKPFNDYYNDFLNMARMLAKLRDIPALIPVYDIFETNNTVYYISENVPSVPLARVLAQHKPLDWKQARSLFMPIINALAALHAAGINHYAVNPSNILVDNEGRLRLTNFSIAAANAAGTYLNPQIYEGYSAIEQYKAGTPLGHYTDVYGLAATIYSAMAGEAPEDSLKRIGHEALAIPEFFTEEVPPNVLAALNKALKVHPETRTRTVDKFKQELTLSNAVSGVVKEYEQEQALADSQKINNVKSGEDAENPDGEEEEGKEKLSRSTIVLISVAGALGLLLIIAVIFVIFQLTGNGNSSSSLPQSNISQLSSQSSISSSPVSGQYAVPPALIGALYDTISDNDDLRYMNIQLQGFAFSDDVEEGRIISVSPDVETVINEGDTVYVTVSLGPQKREVPDVVGLQGYEAASLLSQAGFKVLVEEKDDGKTPKGEVISVDPEEGGEYDYGSTVTIVVSTYEEERNNNNNNDDDDEREPSQTPSRTPSRTPSQTPSREPSEEPSRVEPSSSSSQSPSTSSEPDDANEQTDQSENE